ncbi:hypothetical protein AVEN_229749-1 [Araneus ventricosus]|uniref:Uncharacterized protein n=1 Tax=Araneus ventricosus TaxID=182803 RepID=A0A4Y2JM64_ARAVE|nr:hypothetical protein AVEN_229749-1 [Araneus ventricosus]
MEPGGLVVRSRLRSRMAKTRNPHPTEDPPCLWAWCTVNMTWVKRPPAGVAQKYPHWPGLPKKGVRPVEDQRGDLHQHVEDGIYWVQ